LIQPQWAELWGSMVASGTGTSPTAAEVPAF
jgi:hypothetical protein